jgi:opacity protein-like surface antigen
MRIKLLLYGFFLLSCSQLLRAQDSSLLSKLNDSMSLNGQKSWVTGTFKATHVVNMKTVESPAKGAMVFLIQHRFGQLNSGSYNFFGLDNATLRLGLDYGITDRLTAGVGRSSLLKTYDGFLKFKLLRQTDGSPAMPVSVSLVGSIYNYTENIAFESYLNGIHRTSYATQLLIARKFNSNLSLQLAPTWLHYNLASKVNDKNDVFALGIGGRMKINRRMSINAEYNYLPSGQVVSNTVYNSFSLGWDIETGGHVFQLVFSNSQSMAETQYITQTTGRWGKGDIFFGFNLSRTFNLKKKRHTYSDTPNEKTDHP